MDGKLLTLTLTDQSLTNVQNKSAGHGHFDSKYFVTVTSHNLRKQFKIADFIRACE